MTKPEGGAKILDTGVNIITYCMAVVLQTCQGAQSVTNLQQ